MRKRYAAIYEGVMVANGRIGRLGLSDTLCVLYLGGEAVLVDGRGKCLERCADWEHPIGACLEVVARFEGKLRALLGGS